MGMLADFLFEGHTLMKLILLQLIAAGIVVVLLKKVLDRELFRAMLEKVAGLPADESGAVDQVVVACAGRLSSEEEARLRKVIGERFPRADIVIGRDRSLGGGFILRAGTHMCDLSVWTRLRQIV
jgi:F0F1-type ATP synthase delta subunit